MRRPTVKGCALLHLVQGAKEKFQVLQRVFAVLGDPEKRKVYDQTGSLEDSVSLNKDQGHQSKSTSKSYRTLVSIFRPLWVAASAST